MSKCPAFNQACELYKLGIISGKAKAYMEMYDHLEELRHNRTIPERVWSRLKKELKNRIADEVERYRIMWLEIGTGMKDKLTSEN
jgi:hypothetical protein